MKIKKTPQFLILVALAVGVATTVGWYAYRMMNSTYATLPQVTPDIQGVHVVHGETVVGVTADMQRASDINMVPIVPYTFLPEHRAYATVIDLQPLFELSSRLVAARSDRDSVRAQAESSRAQYERAQELLKDDSNVSLKSMQDARAAALTDQAKLESAKASYQNLQANVRQQFGELLANAAATPVSSVLFRQLATGVAVVVRVTLPAIDKVSVPRHVSIDDMEGASILAHLLSAAPQVDPVIQGTSYFYLAEHALPAGTYMTAHLSAGDMGKVGLLLPERAMVWYGGQRWVYVHTAREQFTRRPVSSIFTTEAGDVIVTSGFREGEDVVVRGAQLLLSEEQRPQGIATQCKDPPECDD